MPSLLNADMPPLMVRAATWATGLGWPPLVAGFLVAAFASDRLTAAVPVGAAGLMLLFLAALAAAIVGGIRQSPHQRGSTWLTAAMALTGAASSGALIALVRLLQEID